MEKFKKFIEKASSLIKLYAESKLAELKANQLRRWRTKRTGNKTVHHGEFLVFERFGFVRYRVKGRIIQWLRFPTEVYIYDPPAFLKKHPHSPCLQLLKPNDRWFKLHFKKPPTDFTIAYNFVEELLNEAYKLRKR